MDSKESQPDNSDETKMTEGQIESTEKSLEDSKVTPQPPYEVSKEMLEGEDDDNLDVDLSAVEIASNLINPNFALDDDPELVMAENMNENYKNILTACSSTAQSIKQAISDVLNSREQVVITEVDPTAELQESLNKKIADFEKAVRGSFALNSMVTDISPEKQAENNGSSAETVEQMSTDGQNPQSSVGQVPEEKGEVGEISNTETKASSSIPVPNSTEETKITPSVDAKLADQKPESDLELPVQDPKTVLPSQLQSANSLKEMLKNTIPNEEEKFGKKQKNGASKKKGEKSIDQIFKSLGNGTSEEKLHILVKKHMETLEELRLVEPRLKQLERQVISQQREKEQLQAEHNRMILAKSRLEGLCREMQRQSKAVKEESLLRIKEEEEKRKEIANKFQATLNDISSLMQENSEKNIQLREENAKLTSKLKSLVDNYEVWEQNMTKVVQQKELEAQLAKAKHAKVNLVLKQETEKFLREKQSLLENLSELQKRCALLATNELQLRTELADYTSKYEEFQSVLSNSSKVFATFKTDMESTSKKIKKLEKETNVYKQKWESSNNALLDMISHKEKQDKEVANAQQRILTLEKLCRALQAERNDLQNQLNIATSNSVSSTNNDVPSLATEAEVAS